MGKIINVDPQKLEAAATSIDTQVADYDKNYKQLFSEVDAMAAAWQGVDNLAFVNQIKGFEDDFKAMSAVMTQYSEFLKASAKAYRGTRDNVVEQAKKLRN